MSRIAPLSGFPEWLPPQRMIEQHVLDRLRTTFELYGFAPLETRAVEPLDQLLRKGETSKEVYVLRRLQADATTPTGRRARAALRPDRAVRPVRAGERRQAAVPVPALPDPEGVAGRAAAGGPVPRVPPGRHRRGRPGHAAVPLRRRDPAGHRRRAARAADPAGADPGQQPQALRGLLPRAWASADPAAALRAVDKLDKIGPAAGRRAAGRRRPAPAAAQAKACLALAEISAEDASFVDAVRALGVERPAARRGARRAGPGGRGGPRAPARACSWPTCKIARGLDYYTGTVYETQLRGYERFGLDLLRRPLRQPGLRPAPTATPASASRSASPGCSACSSAHSALTVSRSVPTCVLVARHRRGAAGRLRPDRGRAAPAGHRDRGVADRGQVRQADPVRRAARHPVRLVPVRRPGRTDEVKDIRSGEQVAGRPGYLDTARRRPAPGGLRLVSRRNCGGPVRV